MTLRKSNWIAAACMAALSCTAAARAGDDGSAGMVRITDGRARTSVQPASFGGYSGGGGYYGSGYGGCPNGDCQPGSGPHCCHGFFRERYCTNSPDHGYSPPAKYPLHRRGVEYNSYFPNQWYGTPGTSYVSAPVVYQPTDTTQMGYSYQHVPFWQPSPGMMPQRPIPAQWHITARTVYASQYHQGYGGCQCPNCQMQTQQMNAPVSNGQPTPLPATTPAPVPNPAAPEAAFPPSPREFENSAASGHIRRAGY